MIAFARSSKRFSHELKKYSIHNYVNLNNLHDCRHFQANLAVAIVLALAQEDHTHIPHHTYTALISSVVLFPFGEKDVTKHITSLNCWEKNGDWGSYSDVWN